MFMCKFHQQHLPIIYEDFLTELPVYFFSTQSKDNNHLPHFLKSVLQQFIEFKEAKLLNALLVEIRHLHSDFLFVSKLRKYLAQQRE